MNLTPLTPFERQIAALERAQHEALARRLADDKRTQLSKITDAAHQRMVEFREITTPVESHTQTRQVKDTSTLTTGAASSPSSESDSSLDSI